MLNISHTYHSLRHSKIIQWVGRLWNLRPRIVREVKVCPAFSVPCLQVEYIPTSVSTNDWDTFDFLHQKHSIKASGWDDVHIPLLWRYNLHYFHYLGIQGYGSWDTSKIDVVQRWLSENPFGRGTAYMPYPTSLRIVNWAKWLWASKRSDERISLRFWNQLRWLSDRPEHHVLGNHLFSNAKALLFGGVFFKGQEADRMINQALAILDKELDEQFQSDGSQFELSPMYHALAMEDLLDILNIRAPLESRFDFSRIERKVIDGLSWLEDFTYSNGEYAHFNDSANGIAPLLKDLKAYAHRLGIEIPNTNGTSLWLHPDSGHVIYRYEGMHIIADVGRAGPDYLMAHAHADTLSFELEWRAQRIIVNSGTSLYERGPERHRQRSTAAHSTVTVNDENSSEVWASFRVARRAYPFGLDIHQDAPNICTIQCSHDGYTRLKGKPVHQRNWHIHGQTITVEDRIIGKFNKATVRYYLHPDLNAIHEDGKLALLKDGERYAVVYSTDESITLHPMIRHTTYHPEFGLSIDNLCLEYDIPASGRIQTHISLH